MVRSSLFSLLAGIALLPSGIHAETHSEAQSTNSRAIPIHTRAVAPLATPSGIQFTCSAEQIKELEKDFEKLFLDYGWIRPFPSSLAKIRLSSDNKQLYLNLNTPVSDTDTLSLHSRPEFMITPEIDSFVDRAGIKHDYKVASQQEIITSMLQNGRLFKFDKTFCTFDKFMEHVRIRKNIIKWGIRAMWKFPEGETQYNKKLWAHGWKLQPGVKSSEAISDAFTGKVNYEIGCTKACQKIMAQGILDFYKNVKKDSKMIDYLDGITAPTPLDTMEMTVHGTSIIDRVQEGTLVDRHFKVPSNHWVPGDWGWIKNPDEESAEENGLEGCNIVYIGRGLFVVYYETDPDRTLDEALVRVYQWRKDSKEEPITDGLKKRLRKDPRDAGLLRDVRDFPKNFHQFSE